MLGVVMTLLFVSIFTFAQAPMDWIGNHTALLADWVKAHMPEGDLRDLITDGAIGGVGSVVTFLPQILILFFFIRAARKHRLHSARGVHHGPTC